ncbi:hypothetical protein [Streptomyces racemochromogenes]|uniref:hypothetical protein n=1 Tax=Streptomyces racemochromogenes TaxID=67353 RepID=UPI0035EE0012
MDEIEDQGVRVVHRPGLAGGCTVSGMTKYETPRDGSGNRLCQYCHEKPVRQSLGTKPVIYCSAVCKQRAYEARKTERAIRAAVAAAEQRAAEAAAKSQTLGAEHHPDGPAKSQTLPGKVSDFAGRESQVDTPTSVTLPVDPTPPDPVIPAPARSEAAQKAFTAAAAAKKPHRSKPLPPAEPSPYGRAGGNSAGWLAAINRITPKAEPQSGLFDVEPTDQGQPDA